MGKLGCQPETLARAASARAVEGWLGSGTGGAGAGVGAVVADAGFFVGFDLGDAAVVDGDLDGAEADGADFFPDDGEPEGFVGGGGGLGVGAHGERGWWDCMATECPLVKCELSGRVLAGIGGGG